MIKADNLTKIYRTKKKEETKALDSLSFVLPEKGMIYIVGKSGSGKSTLLNLIGGLDNITSGEIVSFGNKLSQMSSSDLENYRNTLIGFIFQDFYLLDDLTIFENIKLTLNLQNLSDDNEVYQVLRKVDLEGYANRYPKELSGGQKQRVAIARALVKKPKIILADEPTGNLDDKTTKQITELLKVISQDTLVIIVSHNLNDAYENADRIIELSEGRIINDMVHNDKHASNVVVKNDVLYIPLQKKLSEEELENIRVACEEKKIKKIIQENNQFKTTPKIDYVENKTKLNDQSMSFSERLKLCGKFSKSGIIKMIISSIIAAFLVVILALSQTISSFDKYEALEKNMVASDESSLLIAKSDYLTTEEGLNAFIPITEEEINGYYQSGYSFKINRVINLGLPLGVNYPYGTQIYNTNPLTGFYIMETLGTMITNERFLVNKYGVNNSLSIDTYGADYKKSGVYITDYFADCIIYHANKKYKKYEDIVKEFCPYTNHGHIYINGIIQTNYKERYKEILGKSETETTLSELEKDPEYRKFYDEVVQYLALDYTYNENIIDDIISEKTRTFANALSVTVNREKKLDTYDDVSTASFYNMELEENEIVMDYRTYNACFNANYSPNDLGNFAPIETTLQFYNRSDILKKNPIVSYNVKIKKIAQIPSSIKIIMSNANFGDYFKKSIVNYGLCFDNLDQLHLVLSKAEDNHCLPLSILTRSIMTMAQAVEAFNKFFKLIFAVIATACILIIIRFGLRIVKDRVFEIGVMKALGAKSEDLLSIFVIQIICLGLSICLLSSVGMYFFIGLANDVLVKSLCQLAQSSIMIDIKLLSFKPKIIGIDSLAVMILSLVSTIVPLFAMRMIKPINIIKAKE